MYTIAGCTITDDQMQLWIQTFLSDTEPFFIDNELILNQIQSSGIHVYSRQQFFDIYSDFIGAYGANYQVWSVPTETFVAMVSTEAWNKLENQTRWELFQQQLKLGRGQIYSYDWLKDINMGDIHALQQLLGDNTSFMLTYEAWSNFPKQIRELWLLKWLRERVDDGNGNDLFTSFALPSHSRNIINLYKYKFPSFSRANCFASTAGIITGSENIMKQWMNVEKFFNVLFQTGYTKETEITSEEDIKNIKPNDVLVWETASGKTLHTNYAVSDSHAFNKNGQFWFQPWRIVPLGLVYNYASCLTNGGRLTIYRQHQTFYIADDKKSINELHVMIK